MVDLPIVTMISGVVPKRGCVDLHQAALSLSAPVIDGDDCGRPTRRLAAHYLAGASGRPTLRTGGRGPKNRSMTDGGACTRHHGFGTSPGRTTVALYIIVVV